MLGHNSKINIKLFDFNCLSKKNMHLKIYLNFCYFNFFVKSNTIYIQRWRNWNTRKWWTSRESIKSNGCHWWWNWNTRKWWTSIESKRFNGCHWWWNWNTRKWWTSRESIRSNGCHWWWNWNTRKWWTSIESRWSNYLDKCWNFDRLIVWIHPQKFVIIITW